MVTPLDQRPRSGPYSGISARSAKRFLAQAFADANISFADEDALEIVLAATGLDKTGLILQGTEILEPEIFETISAHMNRRLAGEPIDQILGWREFYGRRFIVSKDVLSPRADTECLIRSALLRLKNTPKPKVLDLGTGSGAIGLTILAEHHDAILTATDVSKGALQVAEKNAVNVNVEARADFLQGSWWDAVPSGSIFDMILSNPPYISDSAMDGLEKEVIGYDPDIALRGGPDGLKAYRDIIAQAETYLAPNGWLGFEIGYDQGGALRDLLHAGVWTQVTVERDLGGLDRVVWAQKQV